LRPQHFTEPVVSRAQAKPEPTLTDVALTVVPLMPETGTAKELLVVVLLPSAPSVFAPQQWTAPVLSTAQAEVAPREMPVTPVRKVEAPVLTCVG
jgi:hypothetical protein